MSGLRETPLLHMVTDGLSAIHVTSIGEVFPEDEAYSVFQKCFKRDGSLKLMIMPPTANMGEQAHDGRPLEIFNVKKIKEKIEIFL